MAPPSTKDLLLVVWFGGRCSLLVRSLAAFVITAPPRSGPQRVPGLRSARRSPRCKPSRRRFHGAGSREPSPARPLLAVARSRRSSSMRPRTPRARAQQLERRRLRLCPCDSFRSLSLDRHNEGLALLDDIRCELCRSAAPDVLHRMDRLGRDEEDLSGTDRLPSDQAFSAYA